MCILENEYRGQTFNLGNNVEVNMINCTIDKLTNQESVITEDISDTKSFINALKLLNTRLCEGTYDVVGTLKPIIKETKCHQTCIHKKKQSYIPLLAMIAIYRGK